MDGLPLLKPPYGHLTAIDLNRGEIAWRVPFGDTPSLRAHPALKDVALPPARRRRCAGRHRHGRRTGLRRRRRLALNAVDAMTGEHALARTAAADADRDADDLSHRRPDGASSSSSPPGIGEKAELVAFARPRATDYSRTRT